MSVASALRHELNDMGLTANFTTYYLTVPTNYWQLQESGESEVNQNELPPPCYEHVLSMDNGVSSEEMLDPPSYESIAEGKAQSAKFENQ